MCLKKKQELSLFIHPHQLNRTSIIVALWGVIESLSNGDGDGDVRGSRTPFQKNADFLDHSMTQGPEEICLSLEHQSPSKTSEKWVILIALQFRRYTFYIP